MAIEYNPDEDHNKDGLRNHEDPDFLKELANQACNPAEAFDDIAIFGCFLTDMEVNTFLEGIRSNNCRLSSLWLTTASWSWPNVHYCHHDPGCHLNGRSVSCVDLVGWCLLRRNFWRFHVIYIAERAGRCRYSCVKF